MNTQADGQRAFAGAPVHEQVYQRFRDMLLFGELEPGQPVTIQGLVDLLGAGMTPVREALRRLTAEGALEAQGNRRIVVPQLSQSDVLELTQARIALEVPLVGTACTKATPKAIAHLQAIDERLDTAIQRGDIRQYLVENHAFHAALYDLADAAIFKALIDSLWLRFGPSLRMVCGQVGTRNVPDQHKVLLEALASGQQEVAMQAIREDVEQGMALISAAIEKA
ncbi:GntR family transcriptional regulator [Thalassococcus lentus]|uniref:GntR family transcriptional regulator n=1 Tax=Thalassococcus lentus TaxID=1210524 RepID=A0ABT4XNT5_9RHOB|nr:GntR family transcriptional regulator [Thalassococcus lentus]MDA7423599.1 GntR family transcriptional regulator [Thalassococcus lentus]